MIPKTQSVCKHCGEPRTSYIHAPDLSDRAHVFEPVSEPASTGEPPPDSVKFVGTRQPTETEIEYGKTLDPMAKECLERNQAKMERAARPSEPSAPHTSAQPVKIKGFLCPKCQQPLKEIRYPSDCMLNRDQWESQLAGDLFCTCHNNGRGHEPNAYFWKYEFTEPAAPQPVSGDAPEPQLSVKCHTCDSLLVYKRKGEQIEIYHNCPGRIMEAVPAQGTPEPPKLEEIAKQIAMECYEHIVLSAAQEIRIQNIAAAILGPYFPPASQTENTLFQKVITFLESCRDKAKAECGIYLTANHFETILESLKLATPASTGSTNPETSFQQFLEADSRAAYGTPWNKNRLRAAFMAGRTGELPAAPGSVEKE